MQLVEQPDGSVLLASTCPFMHCKHRFIVRWMPTKQNGLIVPNFKALNGQMFLMIAKHIKEVHGAANDSHV